MVNPYAMVCLQYAKQGSLEQLFNGEALFSHHSLCPRQGRQRKSITNYMPSQLH
jgi:hypothetical protein